MSEFQPGDRIEHEHGKRTWTYTVLDPVRTIRGKLRLRGPRGGYHTTWWQLADLPLEYLGGEVRLEGEGRNE